MDVPVAAWPQPSGIGAEFGSLPAAWRSMKLPSVPLSCNQYALERQSPMRAMGMCMQKVGWWARMGFPETISVPITLFAFALAAAPFLPGADLGFMKIPALEWPPLKLLGPGLAVILSSGYLPLFRQRSSKPEEPSDNKQSIQDLVAFLQSRGDNVGKDLDLIVSQLSELGSRLCRQPDRMQAGDNILSLATRINDLRQRFLDLHAKHVDANQRGQLILARDIDTRIQGLITLDARALFKSPLEIEPGVLDHALRLCDVVSPPLPFGHRQTPGRLARLACCVAGMIALPIAAVFFLMP